MKIRILVTWLIAAFGVSSNISSAETLAQAIEVLLAEHPNIRAQAYNRLARDEQVRQARSPNYPRLDFQAGVGIENISEP